MQSVIASVEERGPAASLTLAACREWGGANVGARRKSLEDRVGRGDENDCFSLEGMCGEENDGTDEE